MSELKTRNPYNVSGKSVDERLFELERLSIYNLYAIKRILESLRAGNCTWADIDVHLSDVYRKIDSNAAFMGFNENPHKPKIRGKE